MRKTILFCLSLFMSIGMADAEAVSGIFVTAQGSTTVYALSDMPKVTYTESEGVQYAQITLKGNTEPSISVPLTTGEKLVITYGTYEPQGIEGVSSDKVTVTDRAGHKFFTGGKLIIVGKDGRQFDAKGVEIK